MHGTKNIIKTNKYCGINDVKRNSSFRRKNLTYITIYYSISSSPLFKIIMYTNTNTKPGLCTSHIFIQVKSNSLPSQVDVPTILLQYESIQVVKHQIIAAFTLPQGFERGYTFILYIYSSSILNFLVNINTSTWEVV